MEDFGSLSNNGQFFATHSFTNSALLQMYLGAIQYLRGQDEGGGGPKMSVFVHAQGITTVHAGGVKGWQNSVHVVVECPL